MFLICRFETRNTYRKSYFFIITKIEIVFNKKKCNRLFMKLIGIQPRGTFKLVLTFKS